VATAGTVANERIQILKCVSAQAVDLSSNPSPSSNGSSSQAVACIHSTNRDNRQWRRHRGSYSINREVIRLIDKEV